MSWWGTVVCGVSGGAVRPQACAVDIDDLVADRLGRGPRLGGLLPTVPVGDRPVPLTDGHRHAAR